MFCQVRRLLFCLVGLAVILSAGMLSGCDNDGHRWDRGHSTVRPRHDGDRIDRRDDRDGRRGDGDGDRRGDDGDRRDDRGGERGRD